MADFKKDKKEDRLKDYVQVNDRIEMFWSKYPNGRISTKIISWTDGIIIMSAEAFRDISDNVPAAIGHAYEKEGSSYINQTSALENCETSAVGRALAIMGFEIKKSVASREEVANAMKQQEEAAQETDRLNDPAIKAKWEMLAGSMDGYQESMQKLKTKGYTWSQIESYLTSKIQERKQAEVSK